MQVMTMRVAGSSCGPPGPDSKLVGKVLVEALLHVRPDGALHVQLPSAYLGFPDSAGVALGVPGGFEAPTIVVAQRVLHGR